ncbi:unnamed protein product [Knipowitschia caucasica]
MWSVVFAALSVRTVQCLVNPLFVTRTHAVGETVTLTCPRSVEMVDSPTFHWIRVLSGNSFDILGSTPSFDFDKEIKTSRTTAKQGQGTFDLIIHSSTLQDTGFYYCVKVSLLDMKLVFGIFLKIKGSDSEMKVLSPVDSGDSVNVECSVQMDAQCFEEHMVWWFGSGPDYGLVWTEKNSSAQCDSSPAPQTCFYTFSKTLNASDSGSLHCAVAACGRVLFGNATKVIVKEAESDELSVLRKIVIILSVALAVSVMCIIVLICFIKRNGLCFHVEHIGDERVGDGQTMSLREAEVIYSDPKCNKSTADRSQRRAVKAEEHVLYSDVRDKL